MDKATEYFSIIFTAEIFISLLAMGVSYFKDYFRVFDLVVVLFSIMDIILN
jgi:hypothetical protein